MTGVHGSGRQATDGPNQFFPAQRLRVVEGPSLNQFRERRGAGYRGNAALGQKPDLVDVPVGNSYGKFEDIATGGILHLNGSIGIGHYARISGVPKVVEDLGGVHRTRL